MIFTEKFMKYIDEECRELVLFFNSIGLKTRFCCQGHYDSSQFYINFDSSVKDEQISNFITIIRNNNYESIGKFTKEGPRDTWEYQLKKIACQENYKCAKEDLENFKRIYREKVNDYNELKITKTKEIHESYYLEIKDHCGGCLNEIVQRVAFLYNDTFKSYGTLSVNYNNCKSRKEKHVQFLNYPNIFVEGSDSTSSVEMEFGIKALTELFYTISQFIGENVNSQNFNQMFSYLIDYEDNLKESYCEDCLLKMKENLIKDCENLIPELEIAILNLAYDADKLSVCNVKIIPTENIRCNKTLEDFEDYKSICSNYNGFIPGYCFGRCDECEWEKECQDYNDELELKTFNDMELISTFEDNNKNTIYVYTGKVLNKEFNFRDKDEVILFSYNNKNNLLNDLNLGYTMFSIESNTCFTTKLEEFKNIDNEIIKKYVEENKVFLLKKLKELKESKDI